MHIFRSISEYYSHSTKIRDVFGAIRCKRYGFILIFRLIHYISFYCATFWVKAHLQAVYKSDKTLFNATILFSIKCRNVERPNHNPQVSCTPDQVPTLSKRNQKTTQVLWKNGRLVNVRQILIIQNIVKLIHTLKAYIKTQFCIHQDIVTLSSYGISTLVLVTANLYIFCNVFNLESLITKPTCYKNPETILR